MDNEDRSSARERRLPGTEDERLIPADIGDLDAGLDARMAERLETCGRAGHLWVDPETRVLCKRCGSHWYPGV